MKQKKTNRVALLLHWAGEQKVWLFLAVLLAMAGGLCIVVPYIEIYRLMDAAFGGTCTEELVVRVVAAVAAAVVLRFVLFGASGVVSHKGAYGALFKVRCMVAEHMAKVPLSALSRVSKTRIASRSLRFECDLFNGYEGRHKPALFSNLKDITILFFI